MEPQTIEVPLEVGSTVRLFIEPDIVYEETVEQHVPDTGLIRMSDGTGRAKLLRLLDNCEHFEIVK